MLVAVIPLSVYILLQSHSSPYDLTNYSLFCVYIYIQISLLASQDLHFGMTMLNHFFVLFVMGDKCFDIL